MKPKLFLFLDAENAACVSAYINSGLQPGTPVSLDYFFSLPDVCNDFDIPVIITQDDLATELDGLGAGSIKDAISNYKRAGIIVIPTNAYTQVPHYGKGFMELDLGIIIKNSIAVILDGRMPAKTVFYI
jgi:hypothetical protein